MTPKEIKEQPITIPFGELYNLLFDIDGADYEQVKVNKLVWTQMILVPSSEDLLHFDSDDETIWRRESWLTDAKFRAKQQEESEKRRQLFYLREEAFNIMDKELRSLAPLPLEQRQMIIWAILNKKDLKNAKRFGINPIEEPKWKELFV